MISLLCICAFLPVILGATDDHYDVPEAGLTEFPSDIPSGTRFIDVQYNSISHVPPEALQGLPVMDFDLSGNQLTAFPDLRAIAGTLWYLRMRFNQLSYINATLVEALYSLRQLYLRDNQIASFPTLRTGACLSILEFTLSNNPLQTMPSVKHFTSLRSLALRNGALTLPVDLGNAAETIEGLYLYTNEISGFPKSYLTKATLLRNLYLQRTQVTSLSSPCFGEITGVTLRLESTPLDVCSCQHVWLKVMSLAGAAVTVDDVTCPATGKLWSASTLKELMLDCPRVVSDRSEGRAQRTFRGFFCAFPKHSLIQGATQLRCLGVCLRVPGCVSFNFRRRLGSRGDCVILAPGGDLDLVVPDAEEPDWEYYAL